MKCLGLLQFLYKKCAHSYRKHTCWGQVDVMTVNEQKIHPHFLINAKLIYHQTIFFSLNADIENKYYEQR